MATRGKKTRKKAVAKKKRGPAKKSRSASAKKSSASSRRAKRPVMKKKSAAKKSAPAKKSAAPKKPAPPKSDGGSPMSRVKRVAQEVAHQATTAVSEGAHALKELGENIVERVTG